MGNRATFGGAGKTRLLIVLCAALVLAVLVAAGCGSSDKGTTEQEQEQEQVTEQTGTGNDEVTTTTSNGGTSDSDGIPASGGNSDFSLDLQEIGAGNNTQQLKMTDITWADYGDYFRIIFELKNADGSDVTIIPHCTTWYVSEYYDIGISFYNITTYKFTYAPFAEAEVPVSLGDPLVESIQRMFTADTEPINFEVMCAYSEAHPGVSSRPHRLRYETNPMRVILDIQKM